MTETPAQRQRKILGVGPRVEPLLPDDMDGFALEMHERIRAIANRDLIPKTLETLPQIVPTLLRHPALFEKHTALGIFFSAQGTLPKRDRELAILRVGWLCGAPYEFGEHVHLARDAGISDAEVAAVKVGAAASGWSAHERALLTAVEELLASAMISDETWATLSEAYDTKQLIELPLLIGHYQQTAYLQNSLRLRLHPGNEGLLAGEDSGADIIG